MQDNHHQPQNDCADQAPPHDNHGEQEKQLARVSGNIAAAVLDFVQTRSTFTGPELHAYVANRASVAPGSADRVLRLLKRTGQVKYLVVNRAESRYQVVKSGAAT